LHCAKKARPPPTRHWAAVYPDFYTEKERRPLNAAVPDTRKSFGNAGCRFALFFELDLKINISLFTNYEINVFV